MVRAVSSCNSCASSQRSVNKSRVIAIDLVSNKKFLYRKSHLQGGIGLVMGGDLKVGRALRAGIVPVRLGYPTGDELILCTGERATYLRRWEWGMAYQCQ